MLTSNYSAVRLSEGTLEGNLYATTSANMHVGHSNEDVPGFSKGPEPSFENTARAQAQVVHLGFMAL